MHINDYKKAYYEGQPLISDDEFDEKFSSDDEVGYKSDDNKIKHFRKMYSLKKTYSNIDVDNFIKMHQYIVEPKFDGIAIELMISNCKIVKAITRGDGEYGKDVTANLKVYLHECAFDIPENKNRDFIIHGELLYAKSNNFSQSEIRGIIAGLVNRKEPDIEYAGTMSIIPYALWDYNNVNVITRSISTILDNYVKKSRMFLFKDSEDILKYEIIDGKPQHKYFHIDGLVYKLLDSNESFTKKFPKFQIALKFKNKTYEAKLLDIVYGVGQTGRETCVGIIDPIELDGKLISKINLYNKNRVEKLCLKIGTTLIIELKGDVIPILVDKKG